MIIQRDIYPTILNQNVGAYFFIRKCQKSDVISFHTINVLLHGVPISRKNSLYKYPISRVGIR